MSSNNCTTTIKAISTLISRGVTPAYTETNGILVINQKCIRNGVVDFSLARRTDTQKKKVSDEKILQKYDVVVNSTGVGTLGRVGQIWDLPEKITADSHVTIVRPDSTLVHPIFFGYVLKRLQPSIEAMGEGSTGQTELSREKLGTITIVLPDLDDQNEAAQLLKSIDDRITLLRETNKTLEAIAQAIFKSWFIDFDPVRAKMEGRAPAGMDEETAALFPDELVESELGLVPKGWSVQGLDQIATYLNGLALQKYPPTGTDDLPVIKIAQLRKGDTIGADKASRAIKPEYVVKDGDVLFSWSGSLEVEIWCGGEGALNQHLFKVTSEKFSKWFYYLWTRKHLEHFRQVAASKATTMGHIQRSHLSDAKVVVPSKQLLQAADALFQPLIDRITANSLQAKTLAEIRDALLPRLISGRLRLIDERAGGAI